MRSHYFMRIWTFSLILMLIGFFGFVLLDTRSLTEAKSLTSNTVTSSSVSVCNSENEGQTWTNPETGQTFMCQFNSEAVQPNAGFPACGPSNDGEEINVGGNWFQCHWVDGRGWTWILIC